MSTDKQDSTKNITANTVRDFNRANEIIIADMNRKANTIQKGFITMMIVALVVLTATFGPLIIGFATARYDYFDKETRTPIASLADSSVISGHIHGNFLMTNGYISENPYFYYYAGTDRLKLKRVPANNADIMRDEETVPYLLTREYFQTRHTWFTDQGWGNPITSTRWGCDGQRCGDVSPEYEFHVPSTSVVLEYNLDTNMNT